VNRHLRVTEADISLGYDEDANATEKLSEGYVVSFAAISRKLKSLGLYAVILAGCGKTLKREPRSRFYRPFILCLMAVYPT